MCLIKDKEIHVLGLYFYFSEIGISSNGWKPFNIYPLSDSYTFFHLLSAISLLI